MFHVERLQKTPVNKGIAAIFMVAFLFFSCIPLRDRIAISDYVIEPNGKEVIGKKNLNAFIFEDPGKGVTFQHYLVAKFRKNNYNEKEFNVPVSGTNCKLLLYDNSEFDKYFQSAHYIRMNTVTANFDNENRPAFIAVSMVSDTNDDCLLENSLLRNIAEDYLKNLKDEYLQYNDSLKP